MTIHAYTHTHSRERGYYAHTHSHTEHTWSRSCFLYVRKLYAQFICTTYCKDFELDFATATATVTYPMHTLLAARSTLHTRRSSRLRFADVLFTLYKNNSRTHTHIEDKNDINFGNTLSQLSVLNKPTTTTTTATQLTIMIMRESKVSNKYFQNWTKNTKNK